VPAEDPAALADAIVLALSQPEERARRAQLGRELVASNYSMAAMIDRIEDLCRTLSNGRARRPRAA